MYNDMLIKVGLFTLGVTIGTVVTASVKNVRLLAQRNKLDYLETRNDDLLETLAIIQLEKTRLENERKKYECILPGIYYAKEDNGAF